MPESSEINHLDPGIRRGDAGDGTFGLWNAAL